MSPNSNLIISAIYEGTDKHGQYKLIKKLGEGTYGKVYLVKHIKSGKRYAVKCQLAIEPSLIREHEIISCLSKLGIHSVPKDCDLVQKSQYHYLIMEHLNSGDLEEQIDFKRVSTDGTVRCMDPKHARIYMAHIVNLLEKLHHLGYLHADIKPANILVRENVPVMIDFGLAVKCRKRNRNSREEICGTLRYMTIRQHDHNYLVKPHDDLWSLGLTFLYLCHDKDLPWTSVGNNNWPEDKLSKAIEKVKKGKFKQYVRNGPKVFRQYFKAISKYKNSSKLPRDCYRELVHYLLNDFPA